MGSLPGNCFTARKLLFVHGVRFAALLGIGGGSMPKGSDGKIDHHIAMTGPDLINFVDDELFPYLAGFKAATDDPQTLEYKIGEIFSELDNKIKSGYNLREILA